MSPGWSTFLLEGANFLLLLAALRWLLFKPIRRSLGERRERMRAEDQEAAKRLEHARAVEAEVKRRRKELEAELERMRQDRLGEARSQAESIVEAGRAAAARESDSSRERLRAIAETQIEDLAAAAASASGAAVARLLREIEGPDIGLALVRSVCRRLTTMRLSGSEPILVQSPRELPIEHRRSIEEALRDYGGHVEYRIDQAIGFGVRVETPQGVVEASAGGLSRYAERVLRDGLLRGSEGSGDDPSA